MRLSSGKNAAIAAFFMLARDGVFSSLARSGRDEHIKIIWKGSR
jgi:hypothetical protein